MLALTVQQPYATLIASGLKWVENRTWRTAYRGLLAIHAGAGSRYLPPAELRRYPTGVIVATCRLVACVDLESLRRLPLDLQTSTGCEYGDVEIAPGAGHTWRQFLAHEHAEGPWCWVLADVQPLDPPVPARGQQGLWEWEPTPATAPAAIPGGLLF